MHGYIAPLRDIEFVLFDVLKIQDSANAIPSYVEVTPDTVSAILEEAGKFCAQVLYPVNHGGDEVGCKLENGVVTTAPGFKQAYRKFVEGGWPGLACDQSYGGQGLATPVRFAFDEMISSTNMSFGLVPLLTHSAYSALKAHAAEALNNTYLRKMVAGVWTGTMNLTEPQCGTDLGLIKTRAEPQTDGSFKIFGTKIFITAGEHDLSENIVHLVLARLPDALPGVRGISLFVCPKFLPNAEGEPGERNALICSSIEKKMGIKASPTCVMNYDGATAWLVGSPNKGLAAMFTMMNTARLAVGIQGLGISEAAYQGAVAYAKSRLQMRAPGGAKYPDRPADPIIVHPDIRRTLMRMRAMTEGCRAMVLWIAHELDVSMLHPDEVRRQEADDLVALMTPVVKSMLTDQGSAAAHDAMQIHGGHGYIRDWGMEQLARDARIAQIYEGTNGIQAMDLVGRKLTTGRGRLARQFFHPVADYIANRPDTSHLAKAFGHLQKTTFWLNNKRSSEPNEAGAAAAEYLRLFGLVAIGYMWSRMAETAEEHVGDKFYRAKISTANFYMTKILPETEGLTASIMAGSAAVMDLPEEAF
jgi:alkylation response protein AidB-like acyl-CoA dehydrogenase